MREKMPSSQPMVSIATRAEEVPNPYVLPLSELEVVALRNLDVLGRARFLRGFDWFLALVDYLELAGEVYISGLLRDGKIDDKGLEKALKWRGRFDLVRRLKRSYHWYDWENRRTLIDKHTGVGLTEPPAFKQLVEDLKKEDVMTVRAKFVCQSKTETAHWGGKQHLVTIRLTPVTDGSEEDKAFFAATPSGQVELGVLTEEAGAAFEIGAKYYLDFTKVLPVAETAPA